MEAYMASGTLRDLKKERFWRRMVRRQIDSGLSIRGWCRRRGLSEALFHWWRRELARRDAERPTFVPVRVMEDDPAVPLGRIDIVLTCGRCVQVRGPVDRALLADVLAVVMSTPVIEREGQGC